MKTAHALPGWLGLALVACGPPSASPDAAAAHDGSVDAATSRDTGVDAALDATDAGAPDTSAPDAGAPDTSAPDAAVVLDSATTRTVTFTPTAIAASAPEMANPLRGQYNWLGVAPSPAGWPDNDSYQRWNWARFETSRHTYNWALIDAELAAARARHGRFGMRLMPLCQGCADHAYMGAQSSIPDDMAAAVNPLIGAAPGETERYVIPDWNSDAYLTRLQEVVSAIGARYHDDPTFAWFDVSAYGNWGEFHLYPFNQTGGPYDHSTQRPITDANARRVVQINAAAFANKLLVVNSEDPAALAEAVATSTPPIGLRVDCLGSDGLAGGQDALMAATGALERWRTAPFITEWCQYNLGSSGADLFVQGAAQVTQFHVSMLSSGNFDHTPTAGAEATAFRAANVSSGYRLRATTASVQLDPATPGVFNVAIHWVDDNVAPTYLAWRVVFGLRGATSTEQSLAVDLRRVMPDVAVDDRETVHTAALPAGTYSVYLRVEDVQGISPPMYLAMAGRDAAGDYVLGSLTLP